MTSHTVRIWICFMRQWPFEIILHWERSRLLSFPLFIAYLILPDIPRDPYEFICSLCLELDWIRRSDRCRWYRPRIMSLGNTESELQCLGLSVHSFQSQFTFSVRTVYPSNSCKFRHEFYHWIPFRFIGKKLCPQLIFVKNDWDAVRAASQKVKDIVVEYDPNFTSGSLDEVYLDITEYLEEYNSKHEESISGADVAREIRDRIFETKNIDSRFALPVRWPRSCHKMI